MTRAYKRKSREPGQPATSPERSNYACQSNAVARQLRRRQEHARRLPQWCGRCGAADPLACRCHYPDPPLTERAIAAWRAAILRTIPIGPVIVPLEVLQWLHRNGGNDRDLALRVWTETGGLVA